MPALAVGVVKAALGHNARLCLRVAVASASGVSRRPRAPPVAKVYLRQLLVLAPTWTQADPRIQSPVVYSSISRRPQMQSRTPAPSHDAACRIAVHGQAAPHDEAQHSLVSLW